MRIKPGCIRGKYNCRIQGGGGVFGETIACSACDGRGRVNPAGPLIPPEFQVDYFTCKKFSEDMMWLLWIDGQK